MSLPSRQDNTRYPGGRETYSVTDGNETIVPIVPRAAGANLFVQAVPGAGATAMVYITGADEADLATTTAWQLWDLGAVTSASADLARHVLLPITGIKFTSTGGDSDFFLVD